MSSSSNNRVQGTVKWFSNKKGYGFITTTDGEEDIFVHQTEVDCGDSYRSLNQGWTVEFERQVDDAGKPKAAKVTAVGGGPCTGPRPRRKRHGGGGGGGGSSKNPPWHAVLSDDVKQSLVAKKIPTRTGTVDIALESQRIKLGTDGYASMAHGDGIIAEGTFTANEDGSITFQWERALEFDGNEWKSRETDNLVTSLSLTDDAVGPVAKDETPQSLWGDNKTDPRDALEKHGFQMKQVILTRKERNRKGK